MSQARRTLRGPHGEPAGTYVAGTREGLPLADDLIAAPGVGEAALAEAVLAGLPGHIVGAPAPVGELLVAAGAQLRRRVAILQRDPRAPLAPAPPPNGIRIEPLGGRGPDDLLEAYLGAYGPGHPDHRPGMPPERERELLAHLMDGEEIGLLLPASQVALRADGTVAGALLLFAFDELAPPLGGPWVGELFAHPEAPRGTGSALLAAGLAAAARAGLETLGLAVTDGNPARRLYERFGFTEARRFVAVLVPG